MTDLKVEEANIQSRQEESNETTQAIAPLKIQTTAMIEITAEQVRKYIAPKATMQEIGFFMGLSRSLGLNPFANEVYLIPFSGVGGLKHVPVVDYHVYLAKAQTNPNFDGITWQFDDQEKPTKVDVTIYRKDWQHPYQHTTFMSEVMRKKADGSPMATWKDKPRGMLMKCGIKEALRIAFAFECGTLPRIAEEISTLSEQVQQREIVLEVEAVEDIEADELITEEPSTEAQGELDMETATTELSELLHLDIETLNEFSAVTYDTQARALLAFMNAIKNKKQRENLETTFQLWLDSKADEKTEEGITEEQKDKIKELAAAAGYSSTGSQGFRDFSAQTLKDRLPLYQLSESQAATLIATLEAKGLEPQANLL